MTPGLNTNLLIAPEISHTRWDRYHLSFLQDSVQHGRRYDPSFRKGFMP